MATINTSDRFSIGNRWAALATVTMGAGSDILQPGQFGMTEISMVLLESGTVTYTRATRTLGGTGTTAILVLGK